MTEMDRKIKEQINEIEIPQSYHKKVEKSLIEIQKQDCAPTKKRHIMKAAVALVCLVIAATLVFSNTKAEAGFMDLFTQNILSFLGLANKDSEEMGVNRTKEEAVSKLDLMMELKEIVMDSQNIYAVVKVTAPTSISFREKMTFDYYGFCEGTNYNTSAVVAGARDCQLLEVAKGKENVATYIVHVATDEQLKEGKDVTVFFKDLITDPQEQEPKVLVEGIWSLNFVAEYNQAKDIIIKGTDDMSLSFLDTTATVKKVKLLPLGLTIVLDVTNVPLDTLHVSDTRVTIRLKMIDGSEKVVDTPDPEADVLTSGGSISESEKKGKIYYSYVNSFKKAIDINQVVGIYIGDLYIPVKG